MSVGGEIRRIRRSKNITQEELAKFLKISAGAISQWECDRTQPDIAQLPLLANYLGVTTDEILGVDIQSMKKKVDRIRNEAKVAWLNSEFEKGAAILREGLRQYPREYALMVDLMDCIWNYKDESDDWETLTEEIISLGERVLLECTNSEIRNDAIKLLCYNYAEYGDEERAVTLANETMPTLSGRENLLYGIYEGRERFEMGRKILWLMAENLRNVICFNNAPLDENGEQKPYSPEEMIKLNQKYIVIMKTLFEAGDLGVFAQPVARACEDVAISMAERENVTEAKRYLKDAERYAKNYDDRDFLNAPHESLLFRGMTEKDIPKRGVGEEYNHYLEVEKKVNSLL